MAAGTSGRLKYLSLVILIVLTVALVLMLRYSRTMKTDGPRYLSSTAVSAAEVLKFVTCLLVLFLEHRSKCSGLRAAVESEVIQKSRETLKVAVPAVLYVIQNNLLFLALSNLDAATYQVTYQLKILTTAMFSVTMLGRRLNRLKWASLLLLVIGIGLVQLPTDSKSKSGDSSADGSNVHLYSSQAIGLGAVLAACFSSGFSGVYLERILKGTPTSLWMRNLQLAFFSIFGSGFMILLYDYGKVRENGFFQGYNWIIWVVILLQAYCGLIIALVVKYADNILKGFAVSISIVMSCIISYWLLGDFHPSWTFAIGATVVIISTFMYGIEGKPRVQKNSSTSYVNSTGSGARNL